MGATVKIIAADPTGFNINEKCGSTKPKQLQETVLAEKADLGIAFDGDGDRLMLVDHHGVLVDGDEILYILGRYHQVQGIAGTLMSNLGLEKSLAKQGIQFERAKVGDRHVAELLKQRHWQLGGEPSGHIINCQWLPSGDGLASALMVLNIMLQQKAPLAELKQGMTKYPQHLINVPLKKDFSPAIQAQLDELVAKAQQELGNNGRILLRASGTEPLLRVMVEGQEQQQVQAFTERLAQQVQALAG